MVPDWGVIIKNKMLLCEFSTRDNFSRAAVIRTKMRNYVESQYDIEKKFGIEVPAVLFICDVSKNEIIQFIENTDCDRIFMFCDYETFKNIPIGENLTSPIYIWGVDGESYPLKND